MSKIISKRAGAFFSSAAGTALVAGLLTVILCFALYQWDNKYTAPGDQPINGVLYITEKQWKETPVHYLIREWMFYPGVLLTPEDLPKVVNAEEPKINGEEYYSRYVSIGQYGGMEMGSTAISPRGSGTYRLTLSLPDRENTYALKMPQVYSAYRLYVNDDLLLQQGNPDPKRYQEGLQERTVTFRGKGYVELLIAVTDKNGFYSGMVYPPALGLSLPVSQMDAARQILFTAVELLAFIVLVVSFYLVVRSKRAVDLWVIPTVVFLMGYLAYPLSRLFFTLPNDPWRLLVNLCFYGFFTALVFLYCANYQWRDRWAVLMKTVAVFLFAAGSLTAFASSFSAKSPQLYFLSDVTDVLQWILMVNLACLVLRTVREEGNYKRLLAAGSSMLFVCMLMSHFLPLYEPICTGWYPEVGMMLFLVVLGFTELADVAEAYRFRLTYGERVQQTERLLALEKAHYAGLQEKIEETRQVRHDLRQHMFALQTMLQQGKTEEMERYLEQYAQAGQSVLSKPFRFCQMQAVDAVLSYYWNKAGQQQVELEFSGEIPALAERLSVELCALLGNLLENALEAIEKQKTGERFLRINVHPSRGKLAIQVVNSCESRADREGQRFYSSKRKDALGIGTHSVQMIAQRYGGYANFINAENTFTAQVVLTLPEDAG